VINAAFGNAEYDAEKLKKYEILKKRAVKRHEVVYAPQYKEFWDVYPFNSGYFMCLKLKGVDAEKTRMHLLTQYGVGTIVLGDDMRVAFSSVELDQIEDLFKIIAQAVKDLRK
jgi:aspartate/methionine/tyrosine aminotransferase